MVSHAHAILASIPMHGNDSLSLELYLAENNNVNMAQWYPSVMSLGNSKKLFSREELVRI
jgi:hypothetical protein